MLKKLSVILKYYDSEPIEILLGIIWLLFFPAIWTSQFGFQTVLITISLLLGISLIKGTCIESLRSRKTLAYGSFLFSIVVIVLLFLNKGIEMSFREVNNSILPMLFKNNLSQFEFQN